MALADLDFRPGIGVQSAVLAKFGLPVSVPIEKSLADFVLVVSFGRCKYRLNEESVGKILQATIGGTAVDFKPMQLDDRVFGFSVTAKLVGLHIYGLRSYECSNYKIYFHLWGQGGASWTREAQDYEAEEENSWTLLQRKRAPKSYAEVVKGVALTGANSVPLQAAWKRPGSVFDRLQQPKLSVFYRLKFDRRQEAKNTERNSNFESSENCWAHGPSPSHGGLASIRCFQCLRFDHLKRNCWFAICCRICHKEGHLARACNSGKGQPIYVSKNSFGASFGGKWDKVNTSGRFKMKARW